MKHFGAAPQLKEAGRERTAGPIYGSSEEEFLLKCVTKELKEKQTNKTATLLFHPPIMEQ